MIEIQEEFVLDPSDLCVISGKVDKTTRPLAPNSRSEALRPSCRGLNTQNKLLPHSMPEAYTESRKTACPKQALTGLPAAIPAPL